MIFRLGVRMVPNLGYNGGSEGKGMVMVVSGSDRFQKLGRLFEGAALVAVGLLGLFLLIELAVKLAGIGSLAIHFDANFYSFLDQVVGFFIIFEFLVMVIEALRNHGHVSITMLMGLGLTALLRRLLVEHGDPVTTLIEVGAIVLLTIGLAIYRYFVHDADEKYGA